MKQKKDKETIENIDDPKMEINFQGIKKSQRKILLYFCNIKILY